MAPPRPLQGWGPNFTGTPTPFNYNVVLSESLKLALAPITLCSAVIVLIN
jgi:hypothetical protein